MSVELNERIKKFYDNSSELWLKTWGEHMHHGYYGNDAPSNVSRAGAQTELIERMLNWGGVHDASTIFDAGCGVGGSARYLAAKFGANVLGVTLSPYQQKAGQEFTKSAGLENAVQIRTQDMMTLSNDDGPFDLIWSMESAEHIPDKSHLISHFYDLLAPGGRLLMATWCRRYCPPELSSNESVLLQRVYEAYELPPMISREEYVDLAVKQGFTEVKSDDWSDAVAPFWNEVIKSAMSPRNLLLLLSSGRQVVAGAWAMRFMRQGYQQGLIKFAVMSAMKPED